MKCGLLKFIGISLLAAVIFLPGVTYAEEPNKHAAGIEETKEVNCCEKMKMM